ncbi:methylmalonyl Co-A mutase-associated GTPase MeaB [bacterium]|nr:methylmalonyl Co-A mutase-associated GTPase MeaB [bacterium]
MNLPGLVRKGKMRSIARALSLIENNEQGKEELIDKLHSYCGNAVVWGVTGPPGAGKSSLVDHIITKLRQDNKKVGVIAVDPSSPFSGGAILGDRVRMQSHSTDNGVFIRSMASRGHLGGVAETTGDAVKVLDAAGYDVIILETIGVGQTEIDVMRIADIILLVMVPGLGDEIQALKAGVMEIGDIFIVNKSDKPGAEKVKAEIEYILSLKYASNPEEKNPVVMTSAADGTGIDELMQTVKTFNADISANGVLSERRKKRIEFELKKILTRKVEEAVHYNLNVKNRIHEWVNDIYNKKVPPYGLINKQAERILKEHTN